MGKSANDYKGERLSFIKIFSQKKYKLVVPIIQRDYAQGRISESVKEVRTDFLDSLYAYLEENKPNRDLDFVYGTPQHDDDDNRPHFIPLDGQQRLTTLFLLHWFLYQISDNVELKKSFKDALFDGNKSLFTYETRQSSTDFCDALMRATINMDKLLTITKKKDKKEVEIKSLSATIRNQSWFFRIWKNDPTVQSMLVMLDAIYHKFNGRAEFFNRLMDEENPVITFIFMDLKEYKLTDDLYIKMNSRGKPLTKFENFKAKFEQYIKTLFEKDADLKAKRFVLDMASAKQEVDLHRYFSYNIDTKWTTLFWQYCKNGKEKQLDTYIENFIRVVVTGYYASIVDLPNKATSDETLDVLMSSDPELRSLSFGKYESTKAMNAEAILEIVKAMDALYNGNQKVRHLMNEEYRFYYDEEAIFAKVLNNNLTRNERIQFYAYIQFIIHNNGEVKGIDEWMRVIHNLSHPENTIIDGNDDMARGIKSIKSILPYSSDIINYLQSNKISGFSSWQSEEECIKARLVDRPNWKEAIENTEKHNYFNGQIGFILEFAGICKAYKDDKALLLTQQQNEEYLNAFNHYAKISSFIFLLGKNGVRKNDVDYCFERAVMSHGDYLLEASNNRRNLLSTETVAKNVKRDLSWKRLLRINETKKDLLEGKALVKETMDDIVNVDDIVASLELQCQNNETEDTWRNILIKSPYLIKICEKGFMTFNDDQVLLLRYWFTNAYHSELYTYHLWKEIIKREVDSFPGFNARYAWQKTVDVIPYIIFSDYTYHRVKYHIYIDTLLGSDCQFCKFCVSFAFDNEKRTDYPDEINDILEELNFERSDQDNSYEWLSKSEEGVYKKIKELTTKLYDLK